MFASLLPGLRELRAPLAAGYIWLFGLWLSLHNLVAVPPGGVTGIYRSIVDLADWAGKPAVFAASALVAYLIGVLSTAATDLIDTFAGWASYSLARGRLEWLKPARMARINVGSTQYDGVVNRLCRRFLEDETFRDAAIKHATDLQSAHARRSSVDAASRLPGILNVERERLKQRAEDNYLTRWNLLSTIVDTSPLVAVAEQDLEYVAPRLIGKEDIVYGEYDRLTAEGNFRINMFLPMCYLFGSLALIASPWWAMGLAAPIALVYLGSYSRGLARRHLVVALAAERVESPALDRLMQAQIGFLPYHEVVVDDRG